MWREKYVALVVAGKMNTKDREYKQGKHSRESPCFIILLTQSESRYVAILIALFLSNGSVEIKAPVKMHDTDKSSFSLNPWGHLTLSQTIPNTSRSLEHIRSFYFNPRPFYDGPVNCYQRSDVSVDV